MVKDLPVNVGDTGDTGSILGLGRSLEKGIPSVIAEIGVTLLITAPSKLKSSFGIF